jgi:hypothetical protein
MFSMTEIHEATLEDLQSWWINPSLTPGNFEQDNALDEVAFGLSRHIPEGIKILKQSLKDKSHRHRAALYFLSTPKLIDDEIREALHGAISGSDKDTRYTALWGFILVEEFKIPEAQLSQCVESTNERTAALAMIYLCRANPNQRVGILRKALKSTNPRLREYACDEIGDYQISELAGEMQALLDDPHKDVLASAKCNLEFFD